MGPYILEMQGIRKEFPGVRALDGVDFRLRAGTVHALVGENGAGKSTLMRCLLGVHSIDAGSIALDGHRIHIPNAHFALTHGIAMIHQELSPIYDRSIMENIWLGREPLAAGVFVDHATMYRDTLEILREVDLKVDPRQKISSLTTAKMQMVEIAKAVSHRARVLIMDEPTSALTGAEVERLFEIIRRLRNGGVGIIYITHKLDEVLTIADEATILRDGRCISTDPVKDLTVDLIISRMVGRQLVDLFPRAERRAGEVVLRVDGLSSGKAFQDVSFQLHRGEILGISGLVGAGRTELVETIFGLRRASRGSIHVRGAAVRIDNPIQAKQLRMGLLTEDRRERGIIAVLPVLHNMMIAALDKFTGALGFVRHKAATGEVGAYMRKLRVKAISWKIPIQNLSGGNQQKVLVARWLLTDAEILLLDEPTRGIDVGSKAEIYALMTSLAAEGKAIIFVSSEMPEIIGMCDRVLVMSQGRMTGIIPRSELTQETIMKLATAYAGR